MALLLNLATASPLMGVLSPPYRDWNSKMKVLRTPETRFTNLPDYPFAPSFLQITPELRLHYVDEGPRDAIPVLMLHGEPTWSYLYRHMIPAIAQAGLRALAPDLIGFGKSDKPAERTDQVAWIRRWVEAMELRNIILVCQDWGSLIGLRVAAETPELNHWGRPCGDRHSRCGARCDRALDDPEPAPSHDWPLIVTYTPAALGNALYRTLRDLQREHHATRMLPLAGGTVTAGNGTRVASCALAGWAEITNITVDLQGAKRGWLA